MRGGFAQFELAGRSASDTPKMERAEATDALARAVRAGSRHAFEQFAKMYVNRLHAFAKRLTGDAHLADDVVQEVLVRAYKAVPTTGADVQRWLFVVTRNAALNIMRTRARHRLHTLQDAPEPATDARGDDLQASERSRRIEAALQELPEQQRTAIVLAKYHAYTCERIAEVLSCSVSAVKMRICRGLRQLRTTLADLDETTEA